MTTMDKDKKTKTIKREEFRLKKKCRNCERFLKSNPDVQTLVVRELDDGKTGHIQITMTKAQNK